MARHLTQYWKPETADQEIEREDVLDHTAGEQLDRVEIGDTVWILTVRAGALYLVGRLRVDEKTDQRGAAQRLARTDLWEATIHLISIAAEPLRNVDLTSIADRLRFQGRNDRLQLDGGVVRAQQFQTMRILTRESAALLSDFTTSGGLPTPMENTRLTPLQTFAPFVRIATRSFTWAA